MVRTGTSTFGWGVSLPQICGSPGGRGETTYTAVCWQARWEPLAEAIRHLQMAETEGAWQTEAGMDHLSEGQIRAALLLRGNTVAYAEAAGPGADDGAVTDYALQMADYAERRGEP